MFEVRPPAGIHLVKHETVNFCAISHLTPNVPLEARAVRQHHTSLSKRLLGGVCVNCLTYTLHLSHAFPLLAGGDKRTQDSDIARSVAFLQDFRKRQKGVAKKPVRGRGSGD